MRHSSVLALTLATAAALGATASSRAALVNGNFETFDTTINQTFTGWTEDGNVASVAATPIAGSGSASLAKVGGTNSLYQGLTAANQLSQFVYAFDFAASDPGGATGTPRSLNVNLRVGATVGTTTGQINLRVTDPDDNGQGDVQVFAGAAWTTVLANAVAFSTASTSPNVNHVTITGDYTTAPKYTIAVSNALGNAQTGDLTGFHTSAPAAGTTLKWVSFEMGNYTAASGAFLVVDNASLTNPTAAVPEPASLALMALGGVVAMARRHRRA